MTEVEPITLNFDFLNRFAGQKVGILLKLDPNYAGGGTGDEKILYGRLFGENREMIVTLGTGLNEKKYDDGRLIDRTMEGYPFQFWSTRPNIGAARIPYLAVAETLWQITSLEDGQQLFYHAQTGEKDYEIMDPDNNKLGELRGIDFPYKTPYNPWEALSQIGHGEGEDGMKGFFEWRNSILKLTGK